MNSSALKKICILSLGLLFLVIPLLFGENLPTNIGISEKTASIVGIPKSRVDSNSTNTARRILSKEETQKSILSISHINGKFYWSSRENIELNHRISGAFDYFYPDNGSGYIKAYRETDGKIYYMEHVHL